jgi:hypothetical protein
VEEPGIENRAPAAGLGAARCTPTRATALAAGLGAASLRPCVASRHCSRCRSGRSVAAPLHVASRHCSRCRSGRSVAAPLHVASRHCSRCRSGRSVAAPLLAPLLPLPVWAQRRCAPALPPAAGPGAAPLRPYTLSSHLQRATFNLQPLALRASRLRMVYYHIFTRRLAQRYDYDPS